MPGAPGLDSQTWESEDIRTQTIHILGAQRVWESPASGIFWE